MNKYIRIEARKRLADALQISIDQAENVMNNLAFLVKMNKNDVIKNLIRED